MSFPLACLAVFCTTLASAWCWVRYMRYCEQREASRAAWADCGIIALGMVNMVSVVDDHRLAVPILCAAWLGTYVAVRKR